MYSNNDKIIDYLTILDHFDDLPDPRVDRTKKHLLLDILFISLCALLCGAQSFVEIADFGRARIAWFEQYIELPEGIPTHDTFGRVFARLDPEAFSRCFLCWVQTIQSSKTDGRIIAIDGKRVRHSFDTANGNAAIHMVSAWGDDNRMVLGQTKVDDKSNEITAIPILLEMLDLSGSIVTIDAMGTQKAIAGQIISHKADYVLALKGNQTNLHADVKAILDQAIAEQWRDAQDKPITHTCFQKREKDHGRIETRTCWAMTCPDWVEDFALWKDLRSIAVIESTRNINGQISCERRYFLSSLLPNAKQIGQAVRFHWGIENSVHWVLDMVFREDECRIRKDNAPQNMATLRHITLNMLNQEKTTKRSLQRKRLLAAWQPAYLEVLLFGNSQNEKEQNI